jgi:hypothetical protein
MVDLIFRTSGAWGAGKGSPLTKVEVDTNFFALKTAVEDALTNPLQPLQIADIQVIDNQMTITMSDFSTTFGPFPLPAATFRWMGIWQPATDYKTYDLITQLEGMYLVLQNHTSDSVFDPAASNVNGPFYQLIFPYPNVYAFGFFYPGQPGVSIEVGRSMFQHVLIRQVVLQAGLPGSFAYLEDAPADALQFVINQNGLFAGTIDFAAYETVGTFNWTSDTQFEIGDKIQVVRPDVLDIAARDLTVTFNGRLGSLS